MEHRSLSAIMFTDIVGYTAMMQKDERTTIEIVERHREVLKQEVDKMEGEIIQFYGDGSLVLFHSALSAVQCAINIQKASQEKPTIPIRIGIHSGDIVRKGNDIFGDAINLAARIQSEAKEGGVCISENVYTYIKNISEINVVRLGARRLKNVLKPVTIYEIQFEDDVKRSVPDSSRRFTRSLKGIAYFLLVMVALTGLYFVGNLKPPDESIPIEKSIVVLPFDQFSDMSGLEYFTDGIMEDILNQLANMNDLKVISRTTSQKYKQTDKSIPEIAGELGVNYVLEGSIRKSGDSVKVVAQLINARTDAHLMSNEYDRRISNVINMQYDIANDIAEHLKAELLPEEKARMKERLSIDPIAYDYYLKGNYAILEYTLEDNEEAIKYYHKAIQQDSAFADAMAGLASAYIGRFSRYGMDYSWVDSAEIIIDQALALNSKSSHVYAAAGLVFSKQGKPHLSLEANRKALEYNPNNTMAMGNLGAAYKNTGKLAEALHWYEMANDRDPLAYAVKVNMGVIYSYFGQPEEAEKWFVKAKSLQPNSKQVLNALAHMYLAYEQDDKALAMKDSMDRIEEKSWMILEWMADISRLTGDQDETEQLYRKAYSINPGINDDWYAYSPIGLGYILHKKDIIEEGNDFLNMALENRLVELKKGVEDPWTMQEVSVIYCIKNQRDEAINWLKKAVDAGWKDFRFAQRDPWFEHLHGDEEFENILNDVSASLAKMRADYEQMK